MIYILFSFIYMQDEYLVTIPATSYSDWIYFSIESNSIVNIENPETSLNWDLAFQRKHIRTNSGLSGLGNGAAIVDSVGNLEVGAYTWSDNWTAINELPENPNWLTDDLHYDFYDLVTHTFVEGIKNPALNAWGWFDESYYLNPTNYIMFVKCANGVDVIKFWAYDYYENNAGGNISFRYQTGLTYTDNDNCYNETGDVNNDGLINVVDVVNLVSSILGQFTLEECQYLAADFNIDGLVNVVDIVSLVDYILNSD